MENYHVTLPTYFRYKIGNLFKDISTLLYLDCDVIVKKSLGKLFDIDLKDNYCAMILDAESQREAKRLGLKKYFNAGVMLINLDLWRKDNLEKKLFDYTIKNAKKIFWQDQDVINIVNSLYLKDGKSPNATQGGADGLTVNTNSELYNLGLIDKYVWTQHNQYNYTLSFRFESNRAGYWHSGATAAICVHH